MRLHHLTVSAFGPFPGTEHVDFDELNDAGLFLMTGPTGAGKTSLLDAVCFALYGTVPGVREVRSLRSQHAPAEAVPEVVLDFTVRQRRFVLRRRPEWQRPKRRGTGTTTEKAFASITELTGGSEHFLSARAAEVGHLVRDLMGMSAGQFTQVALLPQGEFQTFLRASSQERHDVLQRLFRTDRFARIEEWVGEHSRRLREEARTGHDTVQRLVDGVAERSGTPLPEGVCGDDLAQAAADGRVVAWVEEVVEAAASAAAGAASDHDRAARDSAAARSRWERETRRAELRARRDAARAALLDLAESEPDADRVLDRLAAHERALRCLPVLDELSRSSHAADDADEALARAVRALLRAPLPRWPGAPEADPSELGLAELSTLVGAARDQVAHWEALVPRERAAEQARSARDRDRLALDAASRELAEADTRLLRLPIDIDVTDRDVAVVARRAGRRDLLEAELAGARARHRAASALPAAADRLRELEDRERDARDRAQDARDLLQGLVGRRLAGMAAELAGALADGDACQVCGSTDHPHRATAAADAVTDADHDRADAELGIATEALEQARSAVQAQERTHDALQLAAEGRDAGRAATEVESAVDALDDAVAAGDEQAALEDRLRVLRAEQVSVAERHSAAAGAVARLTELVAAHDRTIAEVAAELSAAAVGEGASVAAAARSLARWGDLVAATRDAVAERDRVLSRHREVEARSAATVRMDGFDDVGPVRAAVLGEEERGRLSGWLREREAARVRGQAVLDDPEVSEPSEAGEDSEVSAGSEDSAGADTSVLLDRLAVDADEAHQQALVAAGTATLELHRAEALAALRDRLVVAVDAWAPLRDTSLRAESVARLVKGRGHDNQLQMRLSAYVLATRLDQVVAAANERLAHMRDQRYVLQRTDRPERRGTPAGLGLEVVDQWTGESRAPSTLSGGETFVVSLALALGLADVVTHEAGGTEVETLFVDEGFGTLDADTLDDVMDRLDGLRAGGRTVGVVSHVTELRDRIPVQVQVEKGRNGSTVQVRSLTRA